MINIANKQQKSDQSIDFGSKIYTFTKKNLLLFSDGFINIETHLNKIVHITSTKLPQKCSQNDARPKKKKKKKKKKTTYT